MPHLQHTLQANRDLDGFWSMPEHTRADLTLALLEASRFPGIRWKRLMIAFANETLVGLEDLYIQSCMAQRQSLLHRVAGNQAEAIRVIDNAWLGEKPGGSCMLSRMHAAAGLLVTQRALNYFQNEELAKALAALDTWEPVYRAPAEAAVFYRIRILRGKILRFQGKFEDALKCLETHVLGDVENLTFAEDCSEMVCEVADTLVELDDPVAAEQMLRVQLGCRDEPQDSAGQILRLSLAETLFAQHRYVEAGEACLDVTSWQSLSKIARLRLFITLAKVQHVQRNWDSAFQYWTEALAAVNEFPPTSGHTTRIIYLSICAILHRQGREELELESRNHIMALEQVSRESEAKYWIAGLRDWLRNLEIML